METSISITLNTLLCNRQGNGSDGSDPYIWPAMLWVNKDTATVGEIGILDNDGAGRAVDLKRATRERRDEAGDPGDAGVLETFAKRAAAKGVDMPVTSAVAAVLEGKLTPGAAVERLLSRDPKEER